MANIMGSTLESEMDALQGLHPYAQVMFMRGVCPWVEVKNGKRTAVIQTKTLQSLSRVEVPPSSNEVREHMNSLEKRGFLKVINQDDESYEIELLFSE